MPAGLRQAFSSGVADVRHATSMIATMPLDDWLDSASLINRWLDEQERIQFSSFRLAKRRREWLAGRICAKRCVLSLHAELGNSAEISIANRPDGRPFAVLPRKPRQAGTCDLSISHSGSYAVALAADGYCGIDIQQSRDTLLRVTERFCLEKEETLLAQAMPDFSRLDRLNCLWSAKEAVRKTLSAMALPEFLQIMLIAVRPGVQQSFLLTFFHHGRSMAVICAPFAEYVIALCCLKDCSHA